MGILRTQGISSSDNRSRLRDRLKTEEFRSSCGHGVGLGELILPLDETIGLTNRFSSLK
jgi:hypothetical protein